MGEIKIKFPQELWEKFQLEVQGEVDETRKAKLIFGLVMADFLSGKASVDDLAGICGRLENNKAVEDEELEDVLHYGAELGFYIRSRERLDVFKSFMEKVLDYAIFR